MRGLLHVTALSYVVAIAHVDSLSPETTVVDLDDEDKELNCTSLLQVTSEVTVGLGPRGLLQHDVRQRTTTKNIAVTEGAVSSRLFLRYAVFFSAFILLAVICVGMYINATFSSDTNSSATAPKAAKDDSGVVEGRLGATFVPQHTSPHQALSRSLRRGTVMFGRDAVALERWTPDSASESMSSFSFVVNMFADLCPPGFLPLAYGMHHIGYVPAIVVMFAFYGVCVYTMWMIGKTVENTGEKTFAGQWSKTISPNTSWVPVVAVVLVCFGCLLTYSCFFADIFTGLMPSFGLPMSRTACLVIFTIFPTLPLCLLKDLSALSYSSTFALFAVLYTAGMMCFRAADGSYAQGGHFFDDLSRNLQPRVPPEHLLELGFASMALVNDFAVAFLSHYNGCKYYRELEHHTPTRFRNCTAVAMGISALVYLVTMVAGYQTFGANADGMILKNYSRSDPFANLARIVMGLSIIASFPLMFSGLREATVALLKQVSPVSCSDIDLVWKQDCLSLFLLAAITGSAAVLTDAGLVVGVVGAICGSAIIYIIPSMLYAYSIEVFLGKEKHVGEIAVLKCVAVLGALLGLAGLATTLLE